NTRCGSTDLVQGHTLADSWGDLPSIHRERTARLRLQSVSPHRQPCHANRATVVRLVLADRCIPADAQGRPDPTVMFVGPDHLPDHSFRDSEASALEISYHVKKLPEPPRP